MVNDVTSSATKGHTHSQRWRERHATPDGFDHVRDQQKERVAAIISNWCSQVGKKVGGLGKIANSNMGGGNISTPAADTSKKHKKHKKRCVKRNSGSGSSGGIGR